MNSTDKTKMYLDDVLSLYEKEKAKFLFELKKNLNSLNPDSFLISMLSLVLKESELESIKQLFTFDEVQTFNQNIDSNYKLNGDCLKKFSLKLKTLLLVSRPTIGEEAIVKLEKMTVENIKEFIELNRDLASSCLSIMSSSKLTSLLNELSQAELEMLLTTNSKSALDYDQQSKKLEDSIKKFDLEQDSPFAKALSAKISTLSIEKEKKVYDQLFEQNKIELIKKTATEAIPSELISKLPSVHLRQSLEGVDADTHATFLSILSSEEQSKWLSVICDDGSKLSTMLQMETKSIRENKDLYNKNQSKQEQIKLQYYKIIRKYFSSPEKKDITSTYIEDWVGERKK